MTPQALIIELQWAKDEAVSAMAQRDQEFCCGPAEDEIGWQNMRRVEAAIGAAIAHLVDGAANNKTA